MATKERFYSLIDSIADERVRAVAEDNAIGNARDVFRRDAASDEDGEFWRMAIDTAAMILDDPTAY